MPPVEFEPTIPTFERAKTVHALDRATTLIGIFTNLLPQNTDLSIRIKADFISFFSRN
jgi:hypothetical protein